MRFLLLALLMPLQIYAQNSPGYVIKGSTNTPSKKAWIYMSRSTERSEKTDSAAFKDGRFEFKGSVTEPTAVKIYFDRKSPKAVFVIDNSKMIFKAADSLNNFSVTGSPAAMAAIEFQKMIAPAEKTYDGYLRDFWATHMNKADNDAEKIASKDRIDRAYDHINDLHLSYLKANPKSPIGIILLNKYVSRKGNMDGLSPIFIAFSSDLKNSASGKAFEARLQTALTLSIGKPALDFNVKSSEGKDVKLSDFKGKYVFLDFWASWCGPCRSEMPHVRNAYNKYKNNGFEVMAVSLDKENKRAEWLKAIEEDKTGAFSQTIDPTGDIARLYDIRSIPQNYLISPEGKIIAKDLRGKDLETFLHKQFNP
ncbi:TlpA disulfide reductase family protein [Pedobacter gandavensis]|uniref:Redoxin domain-containing protein n=1 Tax=Pedobacter gandavensis TaxID=2679963 RepID=A0ABR6EQ02_9SPHI|nr:TlpA disulfide reductase family protein [Pedobacter gandavensis]MBB2147324.1 redoxin domain-containing protein [Pedobacter gandavensis]